VDHEGQDKSKKLQNDTYGSLTAWASPNIRLSHWDDRMPVIRQVAQIEEEWTA
jgi:hypothetical protein